MGKRGSLSIWSSALWSCSYFCFAPFACNIHPITYDMCAVHFTKKITYYYARVLYWLVWVWGFNYSYRPRNERVNSLTPPHPAGGVMRTSWCREHCQDKHFNPCHATLVYIRFQADKPNNMSLTTQSTVQPVPTGNVVTDMDNIVCGRCSASQIVPIRIFIFSRNINMFRHLKLEIALAIPASNDEK